MKHLTAREKLNYPSRYLFNDIVPTIKSMAQSTIKPIFWTSDAFCANWIHIDIFENMEEITTVLDDSRMKPIAPNMPCKSSLFIVGHSENA